MAKPLPECKNFNSQFHRLYGFFFLKSVWLCHLWELAKFLLFIFQFLLPAPEANLTSFKSDFHSCFTVVLLHRATLAILRRHVLTVQGTSLIFERFYHPQPQALQTSSAPPHECKMKKHPYSVPTPLVFKVLLKFP